MPIYEYDCAACRTVVELLIRGSQRPACPRCGGKDLTKRMSSFAVSTGSSERVGGPGPCGSCGDPRGPGSCAMNID